jgi:hypothetical protein
VVPTTYLPGSTVVTSLAFTPDGGILAVGTAVGGGYLLKGIVPHSGPGGITLWDISCLNRPLKPLGRRIQAPAIARR